jgi:triosephosphate isomerase
MLQALGVKYVVLGHSERRALFGETDEEVNRKVLSALNAGLNPILCVGESLEERESGRVEERLGQELRWGLTDVPPKSFSEVVIAYEPVWAIGTAERQRRTKRKPRTRSSGRCSPLFLILAPPQRSVYNTAAA